MYWTDKVNPFLTILIQGIMIAILGKVGLVEVAASTSIRK